MKRFSLFLAFFALFSCSNFKSENAGETLEMDQGGPMQFVEGSQDIPLAKGLSKVSNDDDLGFDSPGGSILSIAYKSENDANMTKDFYLRTLPQMGWKIVKANMASTLDTLDFVREDEKLEIEFVTENKTPLVKFFVESPSK